MSNLIVWGQAIPDAWLTEESRTYLEKLPKDIPSIDWVWQEMDRIWNNIGLDNDKPLACQEIGLFYSHPVWLMNGIFTHVDAESARHRLSIAKYLSHIDVKNIADYGGGFGELAIAIASEIKGASINIIEPYPSRASIERLAGFDSICFKSDLGSGGYDSIVVQDVLEHIEDPIPVAFEVANALRVGGVAVFANCFYPVIECHLPSTFYLRYTFNSIMKSMGLRYIGHVDGASHAVAFQRVGSVSFDATIWPVRLSKFAGPVLNVIRPRLSSFVRFLKNG